MRAWYSIYRSLMKEHPMCRAPYKSAKEGVGILSSVSTFKYEMSCLQQLDALEADKQTTEPLMSSPDGIEHSQ